MRQITRFAFVVAVVLIALPLVQLGSVRPSIVGAHPAAHPPTPPTYDWDTATAGAQPPTSPLLANPSARRFQTLRLAFPVTVPLADVVVDWNQVTLEVAGVFPRTRAHSFAMVHAAMHDAVNAVEGRYEPYMRSPHRRRWVPRPRRPPWARPTEC